MKKTLSIAIAFGAAVLSGCVAMPDVTVQTKPQGATAQQLSTGVSKDAVCVVFPHDQIYGQERYTGSGAEIGLRVQQAVGEAGWRSFAIDADDRQPTLSCERHGGVYVLQVVVEHYEDNYTGWSGKPDRVELNLRLSQLARPEIVREVAYEAKSNLAASGLLEWGNAKPVSLLKNDFDYIVKRLFRDLRGY